MYITYAIDLQTLTAVNILILYADDTNLLVPQKSPVSIHDEFRNIRKWTSENKLSLNLSKCRYLVFRTPNLNLDSLLSLIPDVELVDSIKLLGVFF